MRRNLAGGLGLVALLVAPVALAATFNGHNVDDKWLDGRAVSTTYGAYECAIRFHGDQVFFRVLDSVEIVGQLDEEAISDPHEILVHDFRRGVDWTIDCYNMPR